MDFAFDDVAGMRMALRQALQAEAAKEVPTGCVILDLRRRGRRGPNRLIGQAHNQVETLRDPTAHAEILAITQAAAARGDWRLEETVLYVTKEPCAMCAGAILLARIPRVVFGVHDPVRGAAGSVFSVLPRAPRSPPCEVVGGILEEECRALLQAFFRRRRAVAHTRTGLPDLESPAPEA